MTCFDPYFKNMLTAMWKMNEEGQEGSHVTVSDCRPGLSRR